jgi:hypothetical protein
LPFESKSRLAAENAGLRPAAVVLQYKVGGRAAFTDRERPLFIELFR